jgi:hypothetical protein
LGTFTIGTTDGSGNFTTSGHATEGSVGNRTDIWSVGSTDSDRHVYYIRQAD